MSVVLTKKYEAPPINKDEILRYALCEETNTATLSLLDECLEEILSKLVYKVCFIEASLDEYFNSYSSSLFKKYLADCDKYIIFAATVGIEVDRLISKYSHISPAKAFMFQAIGAERIEALCDAFALDTQKEYKHTKPRISAGYGDMPLEMQKEVFSVLDCPRKIGLSLNNSMLMSPTKSVTAFIGVLK